MDGYISVPKLTVAERKFSRLSFAEPNLKQMEKWVRELPVANVGETAKRLYHALLEVNQFITTPGFRFQLMEILRPPVQFICRELSKHYLNQSVALPDKARKIANLTQALEMHLAMGYKLVVHEQLDSYVSEKTARGTLAACHRAIYHLSGCIKRAAQLYTQSPPGAWLEAHQLYLFAQQSRIHDSKIKDRKLAEPIRTSVLQCYKRLLLLGCCKTNQLRQNDIATLYDAFQEWSEYTKLTSPGEDASLFLVSPESDTPPYYRALRPNLPTAHAMGYDCSDLVSKLTETLSAIQEKREPSQALSIPTSLNDNVLSLVNRALGIITKRAFKRVASDSQVNITIGLSATHYYAAGRVEFQKLLQRDSEEDDLDANYFLDKQRRNDVWSSNTPYGEGSAADMSPIKFTGKNPPEGEQQSSTFKESRVPLINTSPGGYCIKLTKDMSTNLQAGEIIAVRESDNQPWSIGVIRWIRQLLQHGTEFGVELLAPSAKPCGVQSIQRMGEGSEFLRGLLLPELSAIGQPATLITPRLPFQSHHKVLVNTEGRKMKVLLKSKISATASFSQFDIQILDDASVKPADKMQKNGGDDDFDSLWPSL